MCDHTTSRYVEVEKEDYYGEKYTEGEWETENTFEDIDLHRFRCTQCGYIGYYSNRARAFYEEGKGELS